MVSSAVTCTHIIVTYGMGLWLLEQHGYTQKKGVPPICSPKYPEPQYRDCQEQILFFLLVNLHVVCAFVVPSLASGAVGLRTKCPNMRASVIRWTLYSEREASS